MSSSPPELTPGLLLGDRYRIEELIGEGGFGSVFRATQLNLGRAVAIKVLLADVLENDGILRFQREAELLQRLSHPNTVRVLDFGRTPAGAPFLVFELLKGQTLAAEIVRRRGLSAARVGRVASQVLKALMEAHALGIVHRDIKPANVFLSDFEGERDFVKVLDFGIAVGSDSRSVTRQGQIIGTPRYMAPEQIGGQPVTFAADLFALGILMSEALAGRPLFEGLTGLDIAREKVADNPTPHAPEVLRSPLGPLIHRATQKQPSMRYASAAEMLTHLEALLPAARAAGRPGDSRGGEQTSGSGSGSTTALTPAPGGPVSWGGQTSPAPAWTGPVGAGGPVVPPVPAAAGNRGRKRSAPPWLLIPVLGGGVAALALALFLVMPRQGAASKSHDPTTSAVEEQGEGRPVVLTGMLSNSGWIVTFHLIDKASVIEYKHPGDADFVSLGTSHDSLDPATNLPLPRQFVILDDLHGKVPFEVRYRTKSGALKGPFSVMFDTTKESVASVKSTLSMLPQWVAFRVMGTRRLVYFTSLISDKYALRTIRYGFDTDVPDRSLRFKPSDKSGIAGEDEMYLDMPPGSSSVTVELTFIDGTRSERKRFPFKPDLP